MHRLLCAGVIGARTSGALVLLWKVAISSANEACVGPASVMQITDYNLTRMLAHIFACDELHAAIRLRLARGIARRASRRPSFIDEACGGLLSVTILFETMYKEAAHRAYTESLEIYGQLLASMWEGLLDKLAATNAVEDWHRIKQEIVTLISDGIPSQDDCLSPLPLGMPYGTSTASCSEEEAVASLVKFGLDAPTPLRQGLVGFLLCAFAEVSESNLATVVECGGVPVIASSLAPTSSPHDLGQSALEFLEKAVDPNGSHAGEVRGVVATFAAGDGGLILALIAAMTDGKTKAVAVLSGLFNADRALLGKAADATFVAALLDVVEHVGGDAKSQAQIIDILGGCVDSTSGMSIANVVLCAMRAFPTNMKIQMSGCAVLQTCALLLPPASLRPEACSAAVLGCMRLGRLVPQVQKAGCSLLRALSSAEDWSQDGQSAVNTCAVVVAAMQKHGKVPGVFEDGLAVLSAMAIGGLDAQAAVKDCIEAVAVAAAARANVEGGDPTPSVDALRRLTEVEN